MTTRSGLPARFFVRSLLASTALVTIALAVAGALQAAEAQNLPTGGTTVTGNVTINQTLPNRLTINQTSNTAITNWQSFSIGAGYRVDVIQPSTSSAMLARVTGTTTSSIAGQLTATGQLVLVNPNGIAITSTGAVTAGSGFVATTLAISNDDFLSGHWRLTGTGTSAEVSNAGTITVGPGGYAALIGGTVDNSGTIAVPLGKVGLGSGELATLDFSGDGFLQVAVPTAAPGTTALVRNSGKIKSPGGVVEIKAAAAREMARQAINMSGVIEARSITGHDGSITLSGSDGAVKVSGRLSVAARKTKAGKITVTGRDIALTGAKLDASGPSGGTIRIGGDLQGLGTLAHAETTSIDAATSIMANATGTGNGGDIVVWSDVQTAFAGTISATGGLLGGNGGEVEVSSHGLLAYSGLTVLTAPMGKTGTLLLDPYNVTISDAANSGTGLNAGSLTPGLTSNIAISTLETALNTANVTITTGTSSSPGLDAGNITLTSASNAALRWSSSATLTLTAANSISLGTAIDAAAGGLTLNAGSTIGATGAISLARFTLASGNWVQNTAILPTFAAADFRISGGSFLRATGGTGTSGSPYVLSDIYGVEGIGTLLSTDFQLGADIDASQTATWNAGAGFVPIGPPGTPFSATFDGNGHAISKLTINAATGVAAGLFGDISVSGVVENFGLVNATISGSNRLGTLASFNHGSISNAYASGTVTGTDLLGGLVASNQGSITGSRADVTVTGTGVAADVGGLVGLNGTGATIAMSYATGTVSGINNVGGLVGLNEGSISQSYASGPTSGKYDVGGLAGYVDPDGTITQAYALGTVTGTDPTVGVNSNIGGLVGFNYGVISQTYATGLVSSVDASAFVGGLVGASIYDSARTSVTQSYWDTVTTGQANASGANSGTFSATGLTTAQFSDHSNFAGWTFGTTTASTGWVIIDADGSLNNASSTGATRPFLISEYSTTIGNAHQLQLMALDPGANYTLANNIDLASDLSASPSGMWYVASNATSDGYGFVPVGNSSTAFTGTFDGGSHTIANLVINRPNAVNVGLFGAVGANGLIENIGLVGGSVVAQVVVGSLIGYNSGTVSDAYATAAVSGGGVVGGLIGENRPGALVNLSHATGPVTGTTGATGVGGLVGANDYGASIVQSYATGAVTGTVFVGGLVAEDGGRISQSYATGAVTGNSIVGGLVGMVDGAALVSQGYALGAVTGTANSTYVGGLVGFNSGTLVQTYATGSVQVGIGSSDVGGLVGYNQYEAGLSTGSVTQSYWDTVTTGQSIGIGLNNGGTFSAVGLTTAQFADTASLSGLTFGTTPGGSGWVIIDANGTLNNAGGATGATRPFLLSEYSTTISNAHQLQLMALAPSASYTLAGNLDLTSDLSSSQSGMWYVSSNATSDGYGFVPVGNTATPFTGTFDGAGLTISNLTIGRGTGLYVGLFGVIGAAGTVEAVSLSGASISGSGYVGTLAGENDGTIRLASASGLIDAASGAGAVGGLVGYNTGSITSSHANVTLSQVIEDAAGGLVGLNTGTILTSYATGTVYGGATLGGLAGVSRGSITQSYASGAVIATNPSASAIGGLIGENQGPVTESYATGSVTVGTNAYYVGGLIGISDGAITQTYATGAIVAGAGSFRVGGLIGTLDSGNVTQSFWDKTTTGLANGYGSIMTGTFSGVGLTTAEMQDLNSFATTYAGWDFNSVWAPPNQAGQGGSATAYYPELYALSNVVAVNPTGTRLYGAANSTMTALYSGVQSGDYVTTLATISSAANATTAVGTDVATTAVGAAVTSTTGNTYRIIYEPGTLTVNKAMDNLVIALADQSSTYGTAYTLNQMAYTESLNGVTLTGSNIVALSGLTLSVTGTGTATGTLASTAANAYTIGGSGAAASGYIISYVTGQLTVNPLAVQLTGTQVYDGTTNVTATLSVGNKVGSDVVTVSGSALMNGKDVIPGGESLTGASLSGLTLSGAAATNYTLVGGTGTITVTPASISITAATGVTKTYDGTTALPTGTLGYAVSGIYGVDAGQVAVSATSDAYAGVDAGLQSINISGLSLSGMAAADYTLSATTATGTGTISQRAITVTADAQSRLFGRSNPAFTYSVNDLINGDVLSGNLATPATASTPPGSYTITQGNLGNSNYAITYQPALLTIYPSSPAPGDLGSNSNPSTWNFGPDGASYPAVYPKGTQSPIDFIAYLSAGNFDFETICVGGGGRACVRP